MPFPDAYIGYLVEFHGTQDFFECHELLEDYWKEVDPRNKQSHWVALILIAVSCYHHRRENYIGAIKTNRKATRILLQTPSTLISNLGLDYAALIKLLETQALHIENEEQFQPIQLPIVDGTLLDACLLSCDQKGIHWCQPDFKPTHFLIHRHMLRERTPLVQEREKQRLLRQQKNS